MSTNHVPKLPLSNLLKKGSPQKATLNSLYLKSITRYTNIVLFIPKSY